MFRLIRQWLKRQGMRWSLVLHLGPRTIVAYGKIVCAIITERLWVVPPRALRLKGNPTHPNSMEKAS